MLENWREDAGKLERRCWKTGEKMLENWREDAGFASLFVRTIDK
jgi:hypothetical protein